MIRRGTIQGKIEQADVRYLREHIEVSLRSQFLATEPRSHRQKSECRGPGGREHPRPYPSGGGLEPGRQFGGYRSAVLHFEALRCGPLADLGVVHPAGRRPAPARDGRRMPPPARRAALA